MKRELVGIGLVIALAGVGAGASRLAATAQTAPAGMNRATPAMPIHRAMLEPFDLPFGEPTSLEAVTGHLGQSLRLPVVLDLAALERRGLEPSSTVRLKLTGVRLKTGLQLLLDQVGLTYRVFPEDNLLLLTDNTGADDPARRALAELEGLHKDVHDLQDRVDELFDTLSAPETGNDAGIEPPSMIEAAPDDPKAKPAPGHTRPG